MSLGIPKNKILKDIAGAYDPTKRISITTNKDLENIKKTYNIEDEAILHQDDAVSVRMHVNKLQKGDPNCILVFKALKEISLLRVNCDNFLLGYMSSDKQNY